MLLLETLPWAEPCQVASAIPEEEKFWTFLYSGIHTDFTGSHSIIAMLPEEEIKSDSFVELGKELTSDLPCPKNQWFGYLGYGLKNRLEKLPDDKDGYITVPDLWMIKYKLILLFDYDKKIIEVWEKDKKYLSNVPSPTKKQKSSTSIKNLSSNMSKENYLEKVSYIKNAISDGKLSQANLTRKFTGEFNSSSPISIFLDLCKTSPSPYSAFLKFENTYVISSSPERFIFMDSEGKAESRPIKGSAPRFDEDNQDKKSKQNLQNSEKDKAENLMIVDLMRNDFSRSCTKGSVSVESLFDISSYATVHHMSSTITGEKKPEISTIEFIKNCFPPGSMTGTPKIKAMEICSKLEKQKRGIYGGAIGWFGGDGSGDLSVVIRTLIIQDNKFEFQVGGAIVSDSDPIGEWQETLLKAKAIAKTLGISKEELENI